MYIQLNVGGSVWASHKTLQPACSCGTASRITSRRIPRRTTYTKQPYHYCLRRVHVSVRRRPSYLPRASSGPANRNGRTCLRDINCPLKLPVQNTLPDLGTNAPQTHTLHGNRIPFHEMDFRFGIARLRTLYWPLRS